MKLRVLTVALMLLVMIKAPVCSAVEEEVHLHRADGFIFFKDIERNTFGFLYFYLAINNTIHDDMSETLLMMEVSLYSWGNETHRPPIENVTLLELVYGYSFYTEGTEPQTTVVRHPGRLVLEVGETRRWKFNETLPTSNVEVYAYMEVHGGVLLAMSDGQQLTTPATIVISSPNFKSISYELPIFDLHTTIKSPLYLGCKYHGFRFNTTLTPVKTELKIDYERLLEDYNALVEDYEWLMEDHKQMVAKNTSLQNELSNITSALKSTLKDVTLLTGQQTTLRSNLNSVTTMSQLLLGTVLLSALGLVFALLSSPFRGVRAYLFTPGASRFNLIGDRIIVKGGIGYEMDETADKLVKEGLIPVELLPGVHASEWIEQKQLRQDRRAPSIRELLDRRFIRQAHKEIFKEIKK